MCDVQATCKALEKTNGRIERLGTCKALEKTNGRIERLGKKPLNSSIGLLQGFAGSLNIAHKHTLGCRKSNRRTSSISAFRKKALTKCT